jgi:hypothetical protein
MSDFAELGISGRIATPTDTNWDEARAAWNLVADQRPEAVALVESPGDVAKVVSFAAQRGLKVTAQGTGHGAAALDSLAGTILIKTERMRSVEIDAGRRTARVEPGALAIELSQAAQAHGLGSLPGSSPDVGVTGYTLGGGLSWLGRRYGFACNRVRAIELVTADGELRTVDGENDPDLFWALRGGGGGYAIVTALHLDLVAVSEVFAGAVLFPAELGLDAVRAYRDWAATVSDDVTSVVRFITPPPIPDVPEPLRGTPLLTIDGARIGDRAGGEDAFAPMRALGEPIMDTFEQIPAEGLSRIHMDPENPVPGLGHHQLIGNLPDDALATFVELSGPDSGTPLLLTELRHLGGALGRPAEDSGALSHLDAEFVLFGIGMPMTPELGEAINAHLDRLTEAMDPWAVDGGYFNFAERRCDADAILPAATCARLAEVKRRWDPEGTIIANHMVVQAPA